jgi:predicted extracellular nuclease
MLCITFLIGCASSNLADDFDEEEVKKATEEIISFVNNQDTMAILEISNVAMKDALDEETMQLVYEAIAEGGEFKEIKEITVVGQKDKQSEEEFAVAVAKAKYENKTFIYTISFTRQMKLAGLFFK